MQYSDFVKAVLLAAIDDLAASPEKYAERPGRDFTRNRKLGFKQLVLMLLTMEGECIREELYAFFGRSTAAPSKAAFYRQYVMSCMRETVTKITNIRAYLITALYNAPCPLNHEPLLPAGGTA